MTQWIVKRGEQQRTVQDWETVRSYARTGRLRPDDLLRSMDGTEWVKAQDIGDLFSPDMSPASASSGFKKKLATIAIATTLVAVLGLLSFWIWTRTPQYAVRQIEQAIKAHDLQKFQRYVDVDGVSADLFALVKLKVSDSGSVAEAVATTMSSSLQDALKRTLANMVESNEGGPPQIVSDLVGEGSTYSGIEYVKRDGKLAIVGLKFTPERSLEALVFEVRMRDLGSHWQVAGLNVRQIALARLEYDISERRRVAIARKRSERAAAQKRDAEGAKAVASLGLSLASDAVIGGPEGNATATLTLSEPAFDDISATVSSDSAGARAPQVVTIPKGATATTFIVGTVPVGNPVRVTISAEAYGQKRSASLLVNPPPERQYLVFEDVYFDPRQGEYHVSTCPTSKGRRLGSSYRAMVVQNVPRAKDCSHLPAPSTTVRTR